MAETYHILDIRSLPVRLLATLAAGLREGSRCSMALSETDVPSATLLSAAAVDRLGLLVWMLSEDGQSGKNRPASLVQALTGKGEDTQSDEGQYMTFDTAEEFDAAWAAIARR